MSAVAVRLPRWLARSNRHVANPVMGLWAPYLPPWAVVTHRGRRTGRTYRTVVFAYRRRDTLVVALTYGATDWSRNVVAAGSAQITRRGRTTTITRPRVVETARRAELPPGTRWTARVFGSALAADID